MWSTEHTQHTSASAEDVWEHWCEPVRWPEWDHGTRWVTVDGPFREGTRGRLKPVDGPAARFTITEVTPGVGFVDVARLPLATIAFAHHLQQLDEGTSFTHRVTMSGPLAPLFSRLLGRTIADGLPAAMRALAGLAESSPGPRPSA